MREQIARKLAPTLVSADDYENLAAQFKAYQLQAIKERLELEDQLERAGARIIELTSKVESLGAGLAATSEQVKNLAANAERFMTATQGNVVT